jgi:hypothetical protein
MSSNFRQSERPNFRPENLVSALFVFLFMLVPLDFGFPRTYKQEAYRNVAPLG